MNPLHHLRSRRSGRKNEGKHRSKWSGSQGSLKLPFKAVTLRFLGVPAIEYNRHRAVGLSLSVEHISTRMYRFPAHTNVHGVAQRFDSSGQCARYCLGVAVVMKVRY